MCLRDRWLGLVLFGLVSGCPADDDEGEGASTSDETSTSAADTTSSSSGATEESSSGAPAVDYATMVQPIWNAACTCHLQGPSGTMTATVLTLNEDVSYANLVDAPSEQAAGVARITPGDAQASYLWHKLQGTQLTVGGMGTGMPQVGMLTDEQQQTILDWIEGGAPP